MTPTNCPYCQAPLPAAQSGTTQPVILCQACGRAIVIAASVASRPGVNKPASPAKTLMWAGGPVPGLPVKPAVPSAPPVALPSPAAAPSPGTSRADKPSLPGPAAPAVAPADPSPAVARSTTSGQPSLPPPSASPAGSSAPSEVAAAAEAARQRIATAEFATAKTMVPPAPDMAGMVARFSLPRPADPLTVPAPSAADVASGGGEKPAAADSAEPLSRAPTEEAVPAAPAPENRPPEPAASRDVPAVARASDAVPKWAGTASSVGLATGPTVLPSGGRRNLPLIAGGAGVVVLAIVGIALFAGGGKKRSAPEPQQPTAKSLVEAQKPSAPVPPPVAEKPAPPAEAVQPPKPQPAAQEKPAVAEKIAAPAEKPAQPAAPTKGERRVEKKAAAEKPAPKPAADKPAADRPKPSSELAAPKAEKKPAPAAVPAANKSQAAAEAYQRGNAKLLSGALPEAISAFSEAVKLNPNDAQSQRGLGLAYEQSGNAAQAVRHFKLYLKASPNAPDRALIEKRIDRLVGAR